MLLPPTLPRFVLFSPHTCSNAKPFSQLGFLANPVSTHVQPAEMSNQAINSLALISARKTMEALDVLTMVRRSSLLPLPR